MTTPLTALSNIIAADFNPFVDRVRLVGSSNFNARITPDFQSPPTATQPNGTVSALDGTFTLTDSTGATPRSGSPTVLGAGYTNPTDNPSGTTLYTLSSDGFLNTHVTAPGGVAGSFGEGRAVGSGLGFTPSGSSFDIQETGVTDLGYGSNGTSLFTIDLATGNGTSLGATGVGLRSLAVVPEPSAILLGSLAGLGLLRRRRNA